MGNIPQLFNYQDKLVRVIIVDDQPWFVAKDVCEVLDIKNHRDTVARLNMKQKQAKCISSVAEL